MYLLNPHSLDMFKTPLSYRLTGKRPLKKYEVFFDEFLKLGGQLLFDFSETSFSRISKFWVLLLPVIFFEIVIWAFINGVPLSRLRFTFDEGESVVVFTYKGATEMNSIKSSFLARADTIFWHFSHYMIRTSEKARRIEGYSHKSVVLADSDIRENLLFKKYFPFFAERPLIILPFVPANRFLMSRSFDDRICDKIYASGTYHDLSNDMDSVDAVNTFGRFSHHFLREDIARLRPEWIEDGLGAFDEQSGPKQSDYFKRDIVEIFNSYALVVCGDELCGLPAISNFEAMACGAIPIVNGDNYKGLGLEPGIHFLEHSGVVDDLKKWLSPDQLVFESGLTKRRRISEHLLAKVRSSLTQIFEYPHLK